MEKFKVGDRVLSREVGNTSGRCGVIIKDDRSAVPFLIRFDDWHDGHGAGGKEWWLSEFEVTEAPLRIEAGKFYRTRDGRKVGPMKTWGAEEWHAPSANRPFNGGIWLTNGAPKYEGAEDSPPLVAAWVEEATKPAPVSAQVDAITDEYGPGASAKPKFKVGDRVVATADDVDITAGQEYQIIEVDDADEILPVRVADDAGDGWWLSLNGFKIVADGVAAITQPAIVCLIEDGKPKPSAAPYVHQSHEAAATEAARLAGKHKGQEFGVYVLAETKREELPAAKFKVGDSVKRRSSWYNRDTIKDANFVGGRWQYLLNREPGIFYEGELDAAKFEHEWQQLAANGQRGAAIRIIQDKTGLSVDHARLAVNAWADAA